MDIKPYVPEFDVFAVESVGWLEQSGNKWMEHRPDDRFSR